MYPRPRNTEITANAQKPQPRQAAVTYNSVVTNRVARQSNKDTRRPTVSATTPVGISNTIEPAVNAALVSITWKMSSLAWSLNSVSMPQIRDIARLKSPVMR